MAGRQNAKRLVLVSGATGDQGGAVAHSLLRRRFGVRALTRDPRKPAVRVLAERGAELVQGDLDDQESVHRSLDGVYGVFSVQQFSRPATTARSGRGSYSPTLRRRRV